MVKLKKTKFEQVFPKDAGEFQCGADFVVETDPKASGVTSSTRTGISTKFLTTTSSSPSPPERTGRDRMTVST